MNTDTPNRVGAPTKNITFPKTVFTIAGLVAKNPEVCALTIRKRVNTGLASKVLTKLAAKVEKGRSAGRPIFRFMLTEKYDANKANLAKANKSAKAKKDAALAVVGGASV